jgi:hypothetical protein
MKTFKEFSEQAVPAETLAKEKMRADIAKNREIQRIRQGFWSRREAIRTKHRQDSEMHNDLERTHSLP